jgi:DNA-binding transcriptional LysR family regulator
VSSPKLVAALAAEDIDVAITCGYIPEPEATASEVFCAEPLLVGLASMHRLTP